MDPVKFTLEKKKKVEVLFTLVCDKSPKDDFHGTNIVGNFLVRLMLMMRSLVGSSNRSSIIMAEVVFSLLAHHQLGRKRRKRQRHEFHRNHAIRQSCR